MKITATPDSAPFRPYDITIRIESHDEDQAFMQMGNRNVTFPRLLQQENECTAEVIKTFVLMQHEFHKARVSTQQKEE